MARMLVSGSALFGLEAGQVTRAKPTTSAEGFESCYEEKTQPTRTVSICRTLAAATAIWPAEEAGTSGSATLGQMTYGFVARASADRRPAQSGTSEPKSMMLQTRVVEEVLGYRASIRPHSERQALAAVVGLVDGRFLSPWPTHCVQFRGWQQQVLDAGRAGRSTAGRSSNRTASSRMTTSRIQTSNLRLAFARERRLMTPPFFPGTAFDDHRPQRLWASAAQHARSAGRR